MKSASHALAAVLAVACSVAQAQPARRPARSARQNAVPSNGKRDAANHAAVRQVLVEADRNQSVHHLSYSTPSLSQLFKEAVR